MSADEDVPASARSAGTVRPQTRRQRFEARQRRIGALVATASTSVVVVLLVLLVPRLPGWARVREAFFSGKYFGASFGKIASAFWLDVRLWLICGVCILAFGLLVALARSIRSPALYPVRLAATVYTDIARGVPVILWIYLIGFGVVGLIQRRGFFYGYTFWGGVALVFCYSAYVAEVIRAGIEGIHESQRAGARSLGLSVRQTNRFVVLPQAIRRVVPPLMNDLISLQKDVSLLNVLGIVEALRTARVIKDDTFNYTPFVVAALLFLALALPLTRFADYLTARQRRMTSGTAVR